MRVAIRVATALAILGAMLGIAGPVLAATPINPSGSAVASGASQGLVGESSPTSSTAGAELAPLVTGDLSVQLGVDPGQSTVVVIVGVTLAESTPLPARIRVPVPANSTIQWAGEILGGDPRSDPQSEYALATGAGGGQYAEFTLTKSHLGQIEANAGILPTGQSVTAKTTFVQSTPSATTAFAVRMPAGVGGVQVQPSPVSTPEFNKDGESLYTLETKNMSVGSKLDITFSYTKGDATSSDTSSSSSKPSSSQSSMLLIALLAGSAIVFLVAALVIARRSGEAADSDDGLLTEDRAEWDREGEDASVESDEEDEFDAEDVGETSAELDESDDPFSDAEDA
jgi:hypothetical protein